LQAIGKIFILSLLSIGIVCSPAPVDNLAASEILALLSIGIVCSQASVNNLAASELAVPPVMSKLRTFISHVQVRQ